MTTIPQPLRLFLCHASRDKEAVRELYMRLCADGFDPWLDEEKILPGHDWRSEVTAAVRKSDVVLVCLSRHSINKRGFVQKEIKQALDAAAEQPEGSIFIIPVRLEECEVPDGLSHLQWVNLFESHGYEKLLASLRAKTEKSVTDGHPDRQQARAASESRRAGGAVLCDLLKGLLVIAFVLAFKLAVERTTYGERLGLKIYNLLHLSLSSADMPIAIVDIRDLRPAEFNVDGQTGTATPREPLRQVIEAVSEARPEAIGVLIDFSPDEKGYIHPLDREFFRFCLDLRRQRGVPVFLGVGRTASGLPSEWLDGEEYQNLAANIIIPKDRSRMSSEIKREDPWQSPPQPIRAMSAALADAYGRESGDSFQPLLESVMEGLRRVGFVVEKISEKRLGPGLTVKEFLIDFSRVEDVEVVGTIDPLVLRYESQRFKGKVVFVGSGSLDKEENLVEVPGRDRKYPRFFWHAAGAYTLINPRHELTGRGRLVFDIFFALMLLSIVVLIRHYYRRRGASVVAPRQLQGFFTLLATVAAVVVGIVFVRATGVTWDDFLSAPAVLIFHPRIEHRLANFWKGFKGRASDLFWPHL